MSRYRMGDFEDLRELRKKWDESMETPARSLRQIGKELGFEREKADLFLTDNHNTLTKCGAGIEN